MKNVKDEDKHKVMMIEKYRNWKSVTRHHFTNGTTLEGRNGPNEESHGRNERKYEKGESYRRFGP